MTTSLDSGAGRAFPRRLTQFSGSAVASWRLAGSVVATTSPQRTTLSGPQPQRLPDVVAERARFELANRVSPVTAFPVRTPETASVCSLCAREVQFVSNSTATPVQLVFNGTLFLEVP